MSAEPALCQCLRCERYLAQNRIGDGSFINNYCEQCTDGGIPLAKVRAALTDPLAIELLGLTTEECGEVNQRIGKVLRWGWDADFEGTTQQHKLEVELGDNVVAIALLAHNGLVTVEGVLRAARAKLAKLREDAAGPRQRLQVATVPDALTWCAGPTDPVD